MLDFYTISDSTPKPDWPEKINLKRIEGLEFAEFEDLKNKKIIPEIFDYYTDFRWDSNLTLKIYNTILGMYPELKENQLKNKPVKTLFNIISNAIKDNVGLIAYCD